MCGNGWEKQKKNEWTVTDQYIFQDEIGENIKIQKQAIFYP